MLPLAAALALAAVLPAPPAVLADEGDRSSLQVTELFLGQRAVIDIDVVAPAGATVEIDPAAPSWNGVEVIAVIPAPPEPVGGSSVFRFAVTVAPFRLGEGSFTPAVTVLTPDGVARRELPPLTWRVVPTLSAGSPAELSPLAPPVTIGGAESPLLRPAVALGVVILVALAVWAALALTRRLRQTLAQREPRPIPVDAAPSGLDDLEPLLDRDPVAGYRTLAALVRGVIAREYGFPATALTTKEISRRMEGSGANRFQARLVRGFLENCDAVVYAGYRPAGERRRADLTMAREIVGSEP